MSYKLRKEAARDPHKRDHTKNTYYENVHVKYDGVYLNAVVEGEHARDVMCRVYRYHVVEDVIVEPAPAPKPEVEDEDLRPGDFSVSALESKLEFGQFDDVLSELLEAEKSGKNRKTAIEAIEDRIELNGE
jgi:hypothetical protein